ncbi:MAG: hypothetical protein IJI14_16470 [Anaerolineaceae bacterium]|nr:hypothetical protein [Anaerolineaceae bacterium]
MVGVAGDSSLRHRAVSARTVPCDTVRTGQKGVGGDGSWKHRMVLERTVTKDTHVQVGFADSRSLPEKTSPGSGKLERQGWWVFPGTVLSDTVRCLREPSPATPSGPDKTVSAVTVHGSTACCWRELSPKTPMDKPASLTSPTAGKNMSGQRKVGASGLVGVSE